jgi:NAD(P)-dependent dehydrogenase (short-subunit alcohol dehydrogenase family)
MRATVDSKRFGPWALITGASSGIGRELQVSRVTRRLLGDGRRPFIRRP